VVYRIGAVQGEVGTGVYRNKWSDSSKAQVANLQPDSHSDEVEMVAQLKRIRAAGYSAFT